MAEARQNPALGGYLRILRKNKNVKQDEVADAIGVTRTAYSHYENGRNIPPTQILAKLSEYYDVQMDTMVELALKDKNVDGIDNSNYGKTTLEEEELIYYFQRIPDNYKKLVKTMVMECYKDNKKYTDRIIKKH